MNVLDTSAAPPQDETPADGPDSFGTGRSGYLRTMILAMLALGATLASLEAIARHSPPDGLLVRMFQPAGDLVQRSVPTAILFLFFWTIAVLGWKAFRILRERGRLNAPELRTLPRTMAREGATSAHASLRSRLARRRPGIAVAHLARLVQLLRTSGDAQRAHESFRHQAQIAADAAAGDYTMARVFIWAMPILGFIGTVLGIGLSVGEFSGFLTGDIDDIELVKTELSKIASGLAFAFDTTLLGLVGSLVAMLVTSFVQMADESFHGALEKLGLDVVSSFPEATRPGTLTESDVGEFASRVDALTSSFHALSDGVLAWHSSSGALSDEMARLFESEKALVTMVAESSAAITTLTNTVSRTGHDLGAAIRTLANQINSLAAYQDRTAEALRIIDDLGRTVSSLEATTLEGQRIMKRLGGPIEFRLVPTGPEDGVTAGSSAREPAARREPAGSGPIARSDSAARLPGLPAYR
jgi:biopolymer transport protein ExbB/TolQ